MSRYPLLLVLLLSLLTFAGNEPSRIMALGALASHRGRGMQFAYHTWNAEDRDWVVASTYGFRLLLPEDREFHGLRDLIGSLGLGFSFLRLTDVGITPDLGVSLQWGAEEVDRSYLGFHMGMSLRQGLMWIPRSSFGLVPGLGVFQTYNINSDLDSWNVGAFASLGVKF